MNKFKLKIKKGINILIYLIIKIKKDDIFALGSQLAYYLMLSFFPFMVFLITLIGLSPINPNSLMEGLYGVVPAAIVELTQSIIYEVFEDQHKGILGISILLMIWTSSSAFRAVIKGVNNAYGIKDNRSFVKKALIAMAGIFLLAVMIVIALGALVFGDIIGTYIVSHTRFYELFRLLWNIARFAAVFLSMIFIFAYIYIITPAEKMKIADVIPGAISSTIGWMAVSVGFSFYINNFGNYSRFYGSLGAVFVLMTWLFLVSIILILGVEINCVIKETKIKNNL